MTEVVDCGVVGDGVVWRGGKDGLERGGDSCGILKLPSFSFCRRTVVSSEIQ